MRIIPCSKRSSIKDMTTCCGNSYRSARLKRAHKYGAFCSLGLFRGYMIFINETCWRRSYGRNSVSLLHDTPIHNGSEMEYVLIPCNDSKAHKTQEQ